MSKMGRAGMAAQQDTETPEVGEAAVDIRGLSVSILTAKGSLPIVVDVNLRVEPSQIMGIVGESGSGKSVTVTSALRLLPEPPTVVTAEKLSFAGIDVLNARPADIRDLRGSAVGMVFQNPLTSLNPVLQVGFQIEEALQYHSDLSKRERRERAIELLTQVGLPDPVIRYSQYPHEFSGGMRQRVGIAMAIANGPAVLVADEPTTALDVTVQAQILDLIHSLTVSRQMAVLLITHDLGVIAEIADEMAVMYSGSIVEQGSVEQVFARPRHPYTVGLMGSRPSGNDQRERLTAIPGRPPQPAERPRGCAFEPRCFLGHGREVCRTQVPLLIPSGDHLAACHFSDELEGTVIDGEQA